MCQMCRRINQWFLKRFQKDAPYKVLDCAEEEGDAVASATDDNKAASALYKQISEIFSSRSNSIRHLLKPSDHFAGSNDLVYSEKRAFPRSWGDGRSRAQWAMKAEEVAVNHRAPRTVVRGATMVNCGTVGHEAARIRAFMHSRNSPCLLPTF